jgi:hypothetical protein
LARHVVNINDPARPHRIKHHWSPVRIMSHPVPHSLVRDTLPDHEQKQAALSYLNEAWAEARHDGVDGDCLAQASLFAALAELVGTYGEDAVGKFVENLPNRVRNGEFSLFRATQ